MISRESELLDQIENLEEGYKDLKYRCEKRLKEQRVDFLTDLDEILWDYQQTPIIKKKWEEKK